VKNGLFRHEVLEAKRSSQLGDISLAQPLRFWMLAAFAILAASVLVGFMFLGEYSRRSRVTGQLVPNLGLSTVVSPAAGVVAEVGPTEGDRVQGNDALVRVAIPRAMADGRDSLLAIRQGLDARAASVASLGQSQVAQLDAQMLGTRRQLAVTRQELRKVEQSIETVREQVSLSRATADRYRRISGGQYVSQVQIDQQKQSVLELLNEQQALERQATTIRRGIVQMEQTLQELPAQRAVQVAATERDQALVDQERVRQETNGQVLMKAPVSGLVANRLVEPGQAVQAGQPLLTLLPKGSILEAQLLVPSRAIGFVERGDTVLLRYQAYPYQKFGHHVGRVARVSRSAVYTGDINARVGDGQATEPYYRVLVELDSQTVIAYGKPEALRPGMLLEADILGEQRRLYEWLLEPLYSLRGTMGAP